MRSYKTRKAFQKSSVYKRHREQILAIERGVEWKNDVHGEPDLNSIKVVHWNIERGGKLKGIIYTLQNNADLKNADIILLTEADIGMGRSGNKNIPYEIADALNMNYVFANSYVPLTKGDEGEQGHDIENSLSLHGSAILSRFKISSYKVQPLFKTQEVFDKKEKRLGRKNALICTIELRGQKYDFAAVHLDCFTSPKQRARQIRSVIDALGGSDSSAKLIGGDFNTSTYNLKNKFGLARNLFLKMFLGFKKTIEHYMKPEVFFDKPLFNTLKKNGYEFKELNDMSKGTLYFDVYDKTIKEKAVKRIPEFLYTYLEKRLRPWNGHVPLKMDWFAAQNFRINPDKNPVTVELPKWNDKPVSDHNPIAVELIIQ